MEKVRALVRARRFWVGVSGMIVICADTLVGEGTINPDTVQAVTLLVAAWIVGDSLRETA